MRGEQHFGRSRFSEDRQSEPRSATFGCKFSLSLETAADVITVASRESLGCAHRMGTQARQFGYNLDWRDVFPLPQPEVSNPRNYSTKL